METRHTAGRAVPSPSHDLRPPSATSPRKKAPLNSPDRFIAGVSRSNYRLDSPASPTKSSSRRDSATGGSPQKVGVSQGGPQDGNFQHSLALALNLPVSSASRTVLQYGPIATRAGAQIAKATNEESTPAQRSPARANSPKKLVPVRTAAWKVLEAVRSGLRDEVLELR